MHPCKCSFQAVAFLTQATPVFGVENEGIGPKLVTSSTGKDPACIPSYQPRIPTLGSLLDTDLKPEIVVNDYFGEELERVEQVENLDYEYILEFLDRHEPVNAVGLPNVKGKLKSHLAFWTDIKAPDFIIDSYEMVTRSRFILPRSQRLFLIIAPLMFTPILFQKRYPNCYPRVE